MPSQPTSTPNPPPSPWTSTINAHRPSLTSYEALYRHFHAHPELSTQESETASLITTHLRKLSSDLEIHTSIGGHGQIAILRNADGPTILLRADIDALPVQEKTGLPYASTATMMDSRDNLSKPVMHACGHDFHITSLLAAAETLLSCRAAWRGTIVFLFQPAEERGSGAQGMLDDGLYSPGQHGCPLPDVVLGQHVFPLRAGLVATRPGVLMSASDNLQITIHGRGGHASMPHACIDPVLIASHVVVRLQGIVAREVAPSDMAVVTVGSLRAGEAENVIPDNAVIKVNVRTIDEDVRKAVKKAIYRIVRAECDAGGCVKPPDFEIINSFPVTSNDHDVTTKVSQNLQSFFGQDYLQDMKYVMGSEDFGVLASAIDRPSCFWFFGGLEPEKWDELEKQGKLNEVPVNHSPFFAPALEKSLRTGVDAMCVAALSFVGTQV